MIKHYGRDKPEKHLEMPEHPWWENIDPNLHKSSHPFEANICSRLLVWATMLLDLMLLFCLSALFLLMPLGLLLTRIAALIGFNNEWNILRNDAKNAAFYRDLNAKKTTAEIFIAPPKGVTIIESPPKSLPFQSEGFITELSFNSPFETLNPELRASYAYYKKNNTAHAHHWQHEGGPRPTIIIIHGFIVSGVGINDAIFEARSLFHQGFNILFYLQPFHGKKRVTFPYVSGLHFFFGGSFVNECYAHSVFDCRIFLDHLEGKGVTEVGVTGVSLGGLASGLLAAVEPRLQFSVPRMPMVNLADNLLLWPGLALFLKTQKWFGGLTIPELRHTLALTSPLTHTPVIAKERLMIIGGLGDKLICDKTIRILAHHWGDCPVSWHRHGHVSPFGTSNGRVFQAFLAEINFGNSETEKTQETEH